MHKWPANSAPTPTLNPRPLTRPKRDPSATSSCRSCGKPQTLFECGVLGNKGEGGGADGYGEGRELVCSSSSSFHMRHVWPTLKKRWAFASHCFAVLHKSCAKNAKSCPTGYCHRTQALRRTHTQTYIHAGTLGTCDTRESNEFVNRCKLGQYLRREWRQLFGLKSKER